MNQVEIERSGEPTHGVPLEYSDESIIDLVRRGRA